MSTLVIVIVTVVLALCIGIVIGNRLLANPNPKCEPESEIDLTGGAPSEFLKGSTKRVVTLCLDPQGQGVMDSTGNHYYNQLEIYGGLLANGLGFLKCGVETSELYKSSALPIKPEYCKESKARTVGLGIMRWVVAECCLRIGIPPNTPGYKFGAFATLMEQIGHALVYTAAQSYSAKQVLTISNTANSHSPNTRVPSAEAEFCILSPPQGCGPGDVIRLIKESVYQIKDRIMFIMNTVGKKEFWSMGCTDWVYAENSASGLFTAPQNLMSNITSNLDRCMVLSLAFSDKFTSAFALAPNSNEDVVRAKYLSTLNKFLSDKLQLHINLNNNGIYNILRIDTSGSDEIQITPFVEEELPVEDPEIMIRYCDALTEGTGERILKLGQGEPDNIKHFITLMLSTCKLLTELYRTNVYNASTTRTLSISHINEVDKALDAVRYSAGLEIAATGNSYHSLIAESYACARRVAAIVLECAMSGPVLLPKHTEFLNSLTELNLVLADARSDIDALNC